MKRYARLLYGSSTSRPYMTSAMPGMFDDYMVEDNYQALQRSLELDGTSGQLSTTPPIWHRQQGPLGSPPHYRWLDSECVREGRAVRRFASLRTERSVLGKLTGVRPFFLLLCLIFTLAAGLPGQSNLKQAGVCSRCHVVSVLEWEISKHSELGTNCKPVTARARPTSPMSATRFRRTASPVARLPTRCAPGAMRPGALKPRVSPAASRATTPNSLTKPDQIQTYQGDREAHPIHKSVARLEEFRAATERAEALVEQKDWPAGKPLLKRFWPSARGMAGFCGA